MVDIKEYIDNHLRIFSNRSEYHNNGSILVFDEGALSKNAKQRIQRVRDSFNEGFLDNLIIQLKKSEVEIDFNKISDTTVDNLEKLVSLVTSEVGRALIGLSVMQLSIKTICPDQNIRLHKGSVNRKAFSWVDGISMRTLDKNFVTPTLRRHDLLKLNADGFMMTRSLAENYPYSALYKANLRGAKDQWMNLVEELENARTDPLESLKLLLSLLINAAKNFICEADKLLSNLDVLQGIEPNREDAKLIFRRHIEKSDYAARLLEVCMHSLMQVAVVSGSIGDLSLKPLSQMRSANKKHGNIGDIELLYNSDIIESWDAKYGKSYLREEIEEAAEKLQSHEQVQVIGFVITTKIERNEEIESRVKEISALYSVEFIILTFDQWVDLIFERCLSSGMINEQSISRQWLIAYAESLAQKRRKMCPIDEPCLEWVKSFKQEIDTISERKIHF